MSNRTKFAIMFEDEGRLAIEARFQKWLHDEGAMGNGVDDVSEVVLATILNMHCFKASNDRTDGVPKIDDVYDGTANFMRVAFYNVVRFISGPLPDNYKVTKYCRENIVRFMEALPGVR